ncbi:MAG: hypothetical protein KBS96_00850 [Lachnospiraceae bacterium]|nr:hypothetical protein [Candidatus Colinaster scatohippi]
MKRRLYFCILLFIVLILAGCGEADYRSDSHRDREERYDRDEEDDIEQAGAEELGEIIFDENHFNTYNIDFKNSKSYDPVFENRCMYINGSRVYIPTTVREFERLFGTEFVEVDKGAMGGWAYKNDKHQLLKVLIPYEDREQLTENDSFEASKDVSILGFVYCDKSYKNEEDIWHNMDVRFEEVGRETVNEFGYYISASPYEGATSYRFYSPCYQAYYDYIMGTINPEIFNDELEYGIQDIIEYSRGEENVEIAFGDVTCDALDEMIIKTKSFTDPNEYTCAKVFTYNDIDKKLTEIEYISCDVEPTVGRLDDIYAETGMLVQYIRIDNSYEQSTRSEYSVYNRYGSSWRYVELMDRYDKSVYEWSYLINGNPVSKEEYQAKKESLRNGSTYYSPMDKALDVLSSTATLASQADYTGDKNLSKVRLKKAIAELDLKSIGYDANQKNDYSIDADYSQDDGGLNEGEYSIDGASFPGNKEALTAYRAFLKGEKKGADGRSINDYLEQPYDSVYFYYMKNPNSDGYALVINYANASTFNDIYYYENGAVTYKAYFGRHALGASYLYNNEYIICDTNSGCSCLVSIISHLDADYNETEVANIFIERGEACPDPTHEGGFDNFVSLEDYGIGSGVEYVNNILGVYGDEVYDIPSNAVRLK